LLFAAFAQLEHTQQEVHHPVLHALLDQSLQPVQALVPHVQQAHIHQEDQELVRAYPAQQVLILVMVLVLA
jgi:hypothetical protein